MSTIAILWPVKAIFEKRASTVEVDTLVSPHVPTIETNPPKNLKSVGIGFVAFKRGIL